MEILTTHWDKIILVVLVVANVVKGVRDAIDTTPATDDNAFEKFASIVAKASAYLIGIRPKK